MPNSNSPDWFHQPGYKNLLVYRLATIIFDLTLEFCDLFIQKTSRTFDQIVQAVRSGKQNIVEGSLEKSLKSYIKLVGVARASFEELLEDLKDFLRTKQLKLWDKNDPRVMQIRSIRIANSANSANLPNSPNPPNLTNWKSTPESFANLLITLIHLETYLLDQLLRSLEKKFVTAGGYTENLFKKRSDYRKQNSGY